jgi:tripartite-type tricarboxylate transporter receptor subunit TctC
MREAGMELARRQFLRLATGAAALPAATRIAQAQIYPTRPVRLIEGFGPGGTPDVVGRLVGQWLSEHLGQSFVVENRTGAGGTIATDAVVRAPADGYTLLAVTTANAVDASFYDKLNYNFIRDTAPVASVMRTPFVMEVHPSFPAKTVAEFIAYAKANPRRLNMASAGNGTSTHLTGELFKMMSGVDMVHVAYRSGPQAITDLIGGQVQVYFGPMPASIEFIRSGRLRALAVTTATRSEALPDIPSLAEFVPGYETSYWVGIAAPKGTPAAIIEKLNGAINAGLADAGMQSRLAQLGAGAFAGSPAEFGRFIANETEKWAEVVKFSGARPQ